MLEKDNEQYFTRHSSFTEKTKRRLEIYRRRSLLQTYNDDGRYSILTFFFKHINEGLEAREVR
jgi:hypothetical protein